MSRRKLRQSAADWCFFKGHYDAREYYQRLKEIGFTGVEMVDPSRFAAARGAGLEIVNLSGPGMQNGLNRVSNHRELLGEIRQAIKTASENGIRDVIVFSGNRQGQDDSEGLANVAAALKQVVAEAEQARVTLCFEMLNKFDHDDYQADNSRFGFEVAKRVGSPALKILYDVYHMHRMAENILDVMLGNLNQIGHIHVAASPRRDRPRERGEIDYRAIVSQVHAAGYRGYWGQEFLPAGDSLDELAEAYELFESW